MSPRRQIISLAFLTKVVITKTNKIFEQNLRDENLIFIWLLKMKGKLNAGKLSIS